jgi:type IV pilus assembly protein PilB
VKILPEDIDHLLADFLKHSGTIDEKEYDGVVSSVNGSDSGLVVKMISENIVSEELIADSLAQFYGLQRIKLSKDMLAKRPLRKEITNDFVKENRIVPFRATNDSVTVIVADPSALGNINDLKLITGRKVNTLVSTLSEFEDYLASISTSWVEAEKAPVPAKQAKSGKKNREQILEEIKKDIEQSKAEAGDVAGAEVSVRQSDYLIEDLPDDEGEEFIEDVRPGSDVIEFVDSAIEKAVLIGASDVHFEIFRDCGRLRVRRDGVLQDLEEFESFLFENYSAVVTRIKIMSNLDIAERRLPQDGGIAHNIKDKTVDIRVSVLPTAHGERVVMRILDPDAANFSLKDLGFPDSVLALVEKAIHSPQGMVLVTGPTGSGKSTTLYAVLKELNEDGVNILTAEDPVEYDLSGVGQVLVRDNIGLTFAKALKSFLRQDPEIIMVGEIRDKETSDISIKAALTGHLVLSTLHTNDAPSTITRMINMGVPSYLITSALTMVMAQRLARVICEHCKCEDSHDVKTLISLGFSEEEAQKIKPQKGKGCEKCLNSGIKGRQGIYEVLPITDNIREAVIAGKSDIEIKEIARDEGFITMQSVGRQLITDGVISIEEYQRILVLN